MFDHAHSSPLEWLPSTAIRRYDYIVPFQRGLLHLNYVSYPPRIIIPDVYI